MDSCLDAPSDMADERRCAGKIDRRQHQRKSRTYELGPTETHHRGKCFLDCHGVMPRRWSSKLATPVRCCNQLWLRCLRPSRFLLNAGTYSLARTFILK